jgi:hypothetical protein
MILLIWAIAVLLLGFAWDLNEAVCGRLKQQTRSLLGLLSLLLGGIVGFQFGLSAGLGAVGLLLFSAALLQHPAALIAEWLDRRTDFGRRRKRRHTKHRQQL